MNAWQQILRSARQLIRAFDQQITQLPGLGSLFVSKWNIIHGDMETGFSVLGKDGTAQHLDLVSAAKIRGQNCLRLGPKNGQIRRVPLPGAAITDPTSAIALNLDALSPLPAADTLFAIQQISPINKQDQIEVELALASKTRVEHILAKAHELGLRISAIDIRDSKHPLRDPVIDLLRGGPTRQKRTPSALLAAVCGIFLVLAAGLHIWAAVKLEPQQAQLTAQTTPAGVSIATQQRTDRAARLSVMEIWDTVTKVLPDDAWAEHLSIDQGQLRLAGHANNAAALINAFEAEPAFSGVRLAAASVQEDDGRESFDLVAIISPAKAPS